MNIPFETSLYYAYLNLSITISGMKKEMAQGQPETKLGLHIESVLFLYQHQMAHAVTEAFANNLPV